MSGVFLSYRRDDSQGETLHLFDDLREHFGSQRIFIDVTGIEPGKDFRREIESAVGTCDVLIVMIGKNWLDSVDEAGKRRLDDPEDFVRTEVAAALRRNISVIPVLVQRTEMPPPDRLPAEIKALGWRNAFELRHNRWDVDVGELLRALGKEVPNSPTTSTKIDEGRSGKTRETRIGFFFSKNSIVLSVAAAVALGGGLLYSYWPLNDPMGDMEYSTDRFGSDYRGFDVGEPRSCRSECAKDVSCVAFTFVNAGIHGPAGKCYLKNTVPLPTPDFCCISGIKKQ